MLWVMSFLLAMLVTVAWMPALMRLAPRLGLVDRPGTRKVHAVEIPRIGGIAIVLGVMVAALVVIPLSTPDRYFLAAAGILALFGALDDRFDLDYRIKLLGQVLAVTLVVFPGDIQVQFITLEDRVLLPGWVSVPLTFLFLIGVTNAINLADGLDGLAGGATLLCLCALALLSYNMGHLPSTALCLAFAGAVLGFLRFNTFPARVFMGDAGSQLLGFAVGVLSLRATQGENSVVSAATPVLLLALPLLDTLSVMVQRVSEGRSPFSADKNHIHHKLLAMGFDHHEAVVVIYAIQADLFLLAYWLRFESDLKILAVVSVFFVVAIAFLQGAAKHHWRIRGPQRNARESSMAQLLTRLRRPQNLPRWSLYGVAAGACVYASIAVINAVSLSADIRLLLAILLGVTVLLFAILRGGPLSTVEKATLYVTAAVLVYLDSVITQPDSQMAAFTWIAVGAMAGFTAIRLRLATDRPFDLTPLDLIILFIALVIPSLAGSIGLPDQGAAGIAKLVILFYALELIVNRLDVRVVWVRLAASTLLASLVVRPLL